MIFRLKKELTMGIFGVALGLIGWMITNVQVSDGLIAGNYSISPRAFPKFALIVIFVSGVGLVIQSFLEKEREYVEINLKSEFPVLVYFLLLIGYYLLFDKIGFIIDSIIASCGMLALQKCEKWQYYAIVCMLILGLFFLFRFAFHLNMPLGFPLNMVLG